MPGVGLTYGPVMSCLCMWFSCACRGRLAAVAAEAAPRPFSQASCLSSTLSALRQASWMSLIITITPSSSSWHSRGHRPWASPHLLRICIHPCWLRTSMRCGASLSSPTASAGKIVALQRTLPAAGVPAAGIVVQCSVVQEGCPPITNCSAARCCARLCWAGHTPTA